ncbi:MAG: hypothetical protein WC659_01045 [Patescibacteria group bacterium]
MKNQITQVKSHSILSGYILTLILSYLLIPLVRSWFIALRPDYVSGNVASVGLGRGTLDGFVLSYSFLLPILLSLMVVPWRKVLMPTFWGILPILLLNLSTEVYWYFLLVLSLTLFGFLLGLGIRKLYEKLAPVKQTPPSP